MANRFALLIGNSEYQDSEYTRLLSPIEDVLSLAKLLHDPDIGAFDEVVQLINESESRIRREISRLFRKRAKDDLLVLYFSGHGVKDDRGQLYFAAVDTDKDLLRATAIPAGFIRDEMDRCGSLRQVLLLDCCFSGAITRGKNGPEAGASADTAEAFDVSGYGKIILTATDAIQYALEGGQISEAMQASVFTHYLVDGLQSGSADQNADGKIDLDELFEYVSEKVTKATSRRQTPCKFVDRQQQRLVIANNPHRVNAEPPRSQPTAEIALAVPSGATGIFVKSWECPICRTAYPAFDSFLECYEQGDIQIAGAKSERLCISAGNDPLGIISFADWVYVNGYIKQIGPTKCANRKHYREFVIHLSEYYLAGQSRSHKLNLEKKFVAQQGETISFDAYRQWLCPICKTTYTSLEDAVTCHIQGEVNLALTINDKVRALLWQRDPLSISQLDDGSVYTQLYGRVKEIGPLTCEDKKHFREVTFQLIGGVKANQEAELAIEVERTLRVYAGHEHAVNSYGYWVCTACNTIYDSEQEAMECQRQGEVALPFTVGERIHVGPQLNPWKISPGSEENFDHLYGYVKEVGPLQCDDNRHYREITFHIDEVVKVSGAMASAANFEQRFRVYSGSETELAAYLLWKCAICNTAYTSQEAALACEEQEDLEFPLKIGDTFNYGPWNSPAGKFDGWTGSGVIVEIGPIKGRDRQHYIEYVVKYVSSYKMGTGGSNFSPAGVEKLIYNANNRFDKSSGY